MPADDNSSDYLILKFLKLLEKFFVKVDVEVELLPQRLTFYFTLLTFNLHVNETSKKSLLLVPYFL
jgi:hypothetical protein